MCVCVAPFQLALPSLQIALFALESYDTATVSSAVQLFMFALRQLKDNEYGVCVCVSACNSLSHSLTLSLSHSLTLSHTHSLTHTHTLSLTHTHTHSLSLSLTHSLSLSACDFNVNPAFLWFLLFCCSASPHRTNLLRAVAVQGWLGVGGMKLVEVIVQQVVSKHETDLTRRLGAVLSAVTDIAPRVVGELPDVFDRCLAQSNLSARSAQVQEVLQGLRNDGTGSHVMDVLLRVAAVCSSSR